MTDAWHGVSRCVAWWDWPEVGHGEILAHLGARCARGYSDCNLCSGHIYGSWIETLVMPASGQDDKNLAGSR